MSRNVQRHCMTNKLNYAKWNVNWLVYCCVRQENDSYTHNRMHSLKMGTSLKIDYLRFFTYYISFVYKAQLWNNKMSLPQLWNRCRTCHESNPQPKNKARSSHNACRACSFTSYVSQRPVCLDQSATQQCRRSCRIVSGQSHLRTPTIWFASVETVHWRVSTEWRAVKRRQHIKLHMTDSLNNEVWMIILTLSLILLKFAFKGRTCKVTASVESSTNDWETWTHVTTCTRKRMPL
jgi:hypothetical protein